MFGKNTFYDVCAVKAVNAVHPEYTALVSAHLKERTDDSTRLAAHFVPHKRNFLRFADGKGLLAIVEPCCG